MSDRTGRGYAGKPNSKKQQALRKIEVGEARAKIMKELAISNEYLRQIEREYSSASSGRQYRVPNFDGWYFGDDNVQTNDRLGRQ